MKKPLQTTRSSKQRQRRLRVEALESRLLLSADWRNPVNAVDVNRDGLVTPLDALIVLNEIGRRTRLGLTELEPRPAGSSLPYYDVGGDGEIVPLDALRVLNSIRPLTQSQYVLKESSTAASELSVTIGLGGDSGTRTYQFDVDAFFDSGSEGSGIKDALAVYLVDPESPETTLLDRDELGTAIFVLSGSRADFTPGVVRFDGRTVSVDLTELHDRTTGRLVFQLISQNDRSDTSITIRPHSNELDLEGLIPPRFDSRGQLVAPGESLAIAGMSPASAGQFETELRNIRFNRATGRYDAELQLINRGGPVGRDVAVAFPGLPEGAELIGSAGTTSDGNPFVSFRPAIPAGGLGTGQRSEPVRVAITTPALRRFTLATEVWIGEPNRAPIFAPLDPITVRPGQRIDVPLTATDPDGDRVTYSLRTLDGPSMRLGGNGILSVMPTPSQIGSYSITLIASDGSLTSQRDLQIDVVADPLATTRISGQVLDVDGTPLHGLQVEVGGVQGLTMADGRFTLDLGSGPIASDTLRVRGETFPGEASYPFIAEKLPFMLGREIYSGFDNVINRPIYLPKLNTGQPVNPATNSVIESTLRDGHAPVRVDITAGSLLTQQGTPFTGNLSITEVPVELTPAALPPNLFPDQVITIQPGEMVFATPAPLSFPNTAGWEPGTVMDLWSINPVTGEFEIVGAMVVSADGTTIETTSGGIRNSSWHFPAPRPPELLRDPDNELENKDDNCERDEDCAAATSNVLLHSGAIREHHRLVAYQSLGETRSVTLHYHSQRADPRPIIHFGVDNPDSGENRRIVAKISILDIANSEGGAVSNGGSGLSQEQVVSLCMIARCVTNDVPGFDGGQRLPGGEHFWRIPENADGISMAIQAEMQGFPTGIYDYQLDRGNMLLGIAGFTGAMAISFGEIVHVNSINSPFGAGWDIGGIQRLITHRDNSLLLVNGNGGTLRFRPAETSGTFSPPAGDFSTLIRNPDGTHTRTFPDRTVHQFEVNGRLISITDRNGNQTQHVYSGDRLVRIIDPVGLETSFAYRGNRVSTITDPAGRVTQLEHDIDGNLVRIVDPDGSARTFEYDNRHLPIAETDQNGNREQTTFGFHGRATGSVRKDGTILAVSPLQTQALLPPDQTKSANSAPHATPRRTVAINARPNGALTTTILDRAGQRVFSRDSAGSTGQVSRNTDNQITSITSPRGVNTRFTYDALGNVTQISDSIADAQAQNNPLYVGQKFAAGDSPNSLAIADFNGDGALDFVSANLGSNDVSVIMGNSDGTFSQQQRFATGRGPRSVATGDLNGDGIPDLVTANALSNDVSVLLGIGDGTFALQQIYPAGDLPQSIAIGDIDGDGILDLLTANGSSDDVSVLLGNGDGTFASQRLFAVGVSPLSIAIGDLNGDGILDFVTANRYSNDISVLLGNGDGDFAEQRRFAAGNQPISVAMGDVNGDGTLDLVTANSFSGDVSVLLGEGDGNLAEQRRYAVRSSPNSIAIGDVNGDGIPDLVTANGIYLFDTNNVSVLLGNGAGTFGEPTLYGVGNGPRSIVVDDLNGDGSLDLITANFDGWDLSLLLGKRDGTFAEQRRYAVGSRPKSIAIGDLNGDGIADLVTANYAVLSDVSVLLGNGDGTFAPQQRFPVADGSNSIAVGDVNGDGIPDLVTANTLANDISILLGNGDGTFADQSRFRTGTAPRSVVLADVNGDGFLDAMTANGGSGNVSVLIGNGDGVFGEPRFYAVGNNPRSIAIEDVNGDGILDLVTANLDSRFVSVLLGNGDGTFATQRQFAVSNRQYSVAIGDVNGDGFPDLVTTSRNSTGVSLLAGNGDGTFSAPQQFDAGKAPTSVTIGDINGDGIPDLVISNDDSNDVSVMLGNGNGAFVAQYFSAGVRPYALAIGDINGDGMPDIVTANTSSGDVSVLLGTPSNFSVIALPRRMTYEPIFNQVETIRDELGRLIQHDIDPANGNRLATRRYLSTNPGLDRVGDIEWLMSYTYSPRGQVASETDPLGKTTEYAYDALGRVSSISIAVGTNAQAITRYEYDLSGNVTAVIDGNGNRSEFVYDVMNRIIAIQEPDPDGSGPLQPSITTMRYDQRGNLVEHIDALGRATINQYDPLDRLISVTDVLGQQTQYTYDLNGNVSSIKDANGNATRYEYDARDRRIRSTDPDGGVTSFRYDSDDNLIVLTDPVGNVTRFAYDVRGRLVRELDPTENELLYSYDAVNNLVEKTDRNGRITKYEYDELNRLVTEIWVNPDSSIANTIEYAYDLGGNLLSIVDVYSALSFTYDNRNRMLSVDNGGTPDAPHVILNYTYDTLGNVTTVSEIIAGKTGALTEYSFDGRNRMVSIQQSGPDVQPKLVDFVYNEFGQFEELSRFSDLNRNSLVARSQWSYDDLNRLVSLEHGSADSARDLAFFDYEYDAASRITAITDIDGRTAYGYDNRDQLTAALRSSADPRGNESYKYDANGNRLSSHRHNSSYVTGPANRLLSDGTYNYEYDAEGNMSRRIEIATGETREFEWDHRNRLRRVADFSAGGMITMEAEYVYDILNRRIAKTVDADGEGDGVERTEHYVYDRIHVALEFVDVDVSGAADQQVLTLRNLFGPGIDQILTQEEMQAGASRWLLTDHLGTIRDIVSEAGVVLNHIVYNSFGNILNQTDPLLATRYGYTAREFDAEIGLHFYRARYYDMKIGQFVSEDPIGFAGGSNNLFEYVHNRPLGFTDPTGLRVDLGEAWALRWLLGWFMPPNPSGHGYYASPGEQAEWLGDYKPQEFRTKEQFLDYLRDFIKKNPNTPTNPLPLEFCRLGNNKDLLQYIADELNLPVEAPLGDDHIGIPGINGPSITVRPR